MEKEQFNLMAYAVAMEDHDRALTIAKELKERYVTTKDNTLASIFEKIEDALIYRKNEEYDKEQGLWGKISELAKNIDNTLSIFAKARYYDAIADSAKEDTAKKNRYQKKVKGEFEKTGDNILILLASAWIEELPEKAALIFKKVAEEFYKVNLGNLANQAMGRHYWALTETVESSKEEAELGKKAADEFKAGKRDDLYHQAMGFHYRTLGLIAESPKEGAELLKKAADEFKAGKIDDSYHVAMGFHYMALSLIAESPKEGAELLKKAADEVKAGKNDDWYHLTMGVHYMALAKIAESPKEIAELLKKAADEFKAGKNDDTYHKTMGSHYVYVALAEIAESPKEIAELLKKAADEFKAGKIDDSYHVAMGVHYRALSLIAESPEEIAELLKKAADEFKAGKIDDWYHRAMGMHYSALARATESLEERAELNKKAAEKYKKGKDEEQYHKEMAWHYYLSSLLSEDKMKIEGLKSKAVKETDWLFIAGIALSLSKISKKSEKIIYLIKDAISSYEKHLDEKGKELPMFTIFIDGNLRDEKIVKSVTEKTKGYFITKISPFLKNKTVEIDELDDMIGRNDFILMLVENNINEILSFEMGLAYTAGKPVVLFVPGGISNINPIFSKAATITQKLDYAITVLRLFSIIKSGEILEVGKEERERMASFLKSIERIEIPQPKIEFKPSFIEEREKLAGEFKPSFIEEKKSLKQKYGRLRGDKV
jgi:protein required for attachment to host cells